MPHIAQLGSLLRQIACRSARVPSLNDEFAFVFSEGGEHIQHQPACGSGRVDTVRNGSDMNTALTQQVHRVQDIDQGPAQTVHPPHNHSVSGLGVSEQPLHSGPLNCCPASGGDIGEHIAFLNPGRDQRIELQLRVLTRCTHARVSEMSHPAILPHKVRECSDSRQFSSRRVPETRAGPNRCRHRCHFPKASARMSEVLLTECFCQQ